MPARGPSSVSLRGDMIFGMGRGSGGSVNLGSERVWFVALAGDVLCGGDETGWSVSLTWLKHRVSL